MQPYCRCEIKRLSITREFSSYKVHSILKLRGIEMDSYHAQRIFGNLIFIYHCISIIDLSHHFHKNKKIYLTFYSVESSRSVYIKRVCHVIIQVVQW